MNKENPKQTLGKRLRILREGRNLSQNEIAKLLGLHRPAISEIERGNREISVEELFKLTQFFKIPLETLINIDNVNQKNQLNEKSNSENVIEVLFIRHSEAVDDVYNQYGGWADPGQSNNGILKANQIAEDLYHSRHKYEIVYSSPLIRAKEVAEIISNKLSLNLEINQYLKERNTYGLLCGINKDIARIKYPELVQALEKGEYVLASERYEDFSERVKLIIPFLKEQKYKKVICITHGGVFRELLISNFNKFANKLEDGCKILVHITKDKIELVESEGITYK